ncbi:MAG TPA: VPDSG-CTERM sorting domain-containing protein [Verrucomicrobiae bacterium]|nr:VPDSG-CTERM sorting domain-containing protein [Verrucomicrobiae bacterium]
MKRFKQVIAGLVAVSIGGMLTAQANTVQEMGIGANEVVEISSSDVASGINIGPVWVYAGIVNLQVDGVPTQGFCIDPYHWSLSGPQTYSEVPLGAAPKAPGGPMTSATATEIEQLWAKYFPAAMGDNAVAAGLQIAIWELVTETAGHGLPLNTGNTGTFSLLSGNDYGAGADLAWLAANPNAPTASLIGLTGPGQDYVIPSVPDSGTTALLLGLGVCALIAARKNLRFC